jgi:hypothetical protein
MRPAARLVKRNGDTQSKLFVWPLTRRITGTKLDSSAAESNEAGSYFSDRRVRASPFLVSRDLQMVSDQQRITVMLNLVAQLRELQRLRERLKKAELSTRKPRRTARKKALH